MPERRPVPPDTDAFPFPDWSPYPNLADAAKSYLRDADVAVRAILDTTEDPLRDFVLDQFLKPDGQLYQEAVAHTHRSLVIWTGEDLPPVEEADDSVRFISLTRVMHLNRVLEIRMHHSYSSSDAADPQRCLLSVAASIVLPSPDELMPRSRGDIAGGYVRMGMVMSNEEIRFEKNLVEGGTGQMDRLTAFILGLQRQHLAVMR
jgi:hypothetical protein